MQCAGSSLMHAFWTYAFAVVGPGADTLSRYLSTTSRPQSSLTTGIVAGTSIWNVTAEFAGPVQTENSFLAALMASLIAQCIEDARRSGASPDAAKIKSRVCQGRRQPLLPCW